MTVLCTVVIYCASNVSDGYWAFPANTGLKCKCPEEENTAESGTEYREKKTEMVYY